MKSYVGSTKEDLDTLEPESSKIKLVDLLRKKGGKLKICPHFNIKTSV